MIEAILRENFRTEYQTTLPRFDVMSALSRYADGLKMSQLSGVLRVSNGNVTGIVDRLTDENLVERVSVPGDRRASLVRLTHKGIAIFEQQAAAHENWVNQMLGDFSAQEAADIITRLEGLVETLGRGEP